MYENYNQNQVQENQVERQQPKPPEYMINPHNNKPFDPCNVYDTNNPFSPLYVKHKQPGKGFAILSLIMGILAYLVIVPIVNVAFGILGIAFAAIAPSQGSRGGIQTAGLIVSIIGTIVAINFVVYYLDAGNFLALSRVFGF
ncbi:MAG: DUF4190 domain-containing protein [Oscillospiraceae bacterium]|nr:DUF4190 domain-containing protein [Oscillospiraceae bacterium]